jgi:hypothetical protein
MTPWMSSLFSKPVRELLLNPPRPAQLPTTAKQTRCIQKPQPEQTPGSKSGSEQ